MKWEGSRLNNLKKFTRLILIIGIAGTTLLSVPASSGSVTFELLPYQDSESGRNSHAYLPMAGNITEEQQQLFVEEITEYAENANEKWGIPASAIIGMSIIESGYGTTQIAHFANNLFGIKVWGENPANAWQLKGQPDEDFEKAIPVLADYGEDRKVFDESKRRDNWYRAFDSYEEAVNYLAGKLLLNDRYKFALTQYENSIVNSSTYEDASKQYLYDIAEAGYNHKGGEYYKAAVGKIMEKWDLYESDQKSPFKDTRGHWAEASIKELSDLEIVEGFPDGTFLPNEPVTKEQFVKMLVTAMEYPLINEVQTFEDVQNTRWSYPYIEAAVGIFLERDVDHFGPTSIITREEMAIMSAKALSLESVEDYIEFIDSDQINNELGLVGAAAKSEIIIGFNDGTFRPKEPLTRAQASLVINRILSKKQ
jgi:hypothetical protein